MTKTTRIVVNGETWDVPLGFGATYRREIAAQRECEDNAEVLCDLLSLIGYDARPADVASWPLRKRVEAMVYAANVHLRASDNPIPACPRPDWMPDAWRGLSASENERPTVLR